MLKQALENWPTKLMALVIAILLWFFVLGAENPQTTRTLTLPVVSVNAPAGTMPINVTPSEAEVRVHGRTMLLEQADFDRMRLKADLTGARVGEQTAPLTVSGLPLGLQVLPGHPTTAQVRLDKLIERTRPVQCIKVGEPSSEFVVESAIPTPEEITVSGATSVVARVARVVVVVDMSGLNSSHESEAEVEARDLRDVVISGLKFDPERVKVKVTVHAVNNKTVPVRPIIGNPPAGYRVSSVRVNPPVVTIVGEGDALARLSSVSTSRIDISGLRSRKTYTMSINVPGDTSVLGAASVTVTVAVSRMNMPSSGSVGATDVTPDAEQPGLVDGSAEPPAGDTTVPPGDTDTITPTPDSTTESTPGTDDNTDVPAPSIVGE